MERPVSVAARSGGGLRPAPFGLLGDERLARLAAAGHARAFAVVYERHHQALYRYCRSILRDELDAQDALQSTFAAAFAALGRGLRDAPIRPWLFRIAHNESVSALRRRRPTTDLSAASDWCTTSVEDQAAERAEFEMLLRDLRELGERQRSALVMRELSGLSHEEIAIALDTSVGAAKQTIYEARRSLFEFAEGRSVPCDEIRRTISDADGRLLRSRRVRAHLRECPGCAAFAAAIPERGRELRAVVPMLPAVVAAGMLERVAGAGATHGAGNGLAGLAAGAAGKAAGTTMAANALAGIAVVASATVGVTIGVDKLADTSNRGAGHVATPAVRPVAAPGRTSLPAVGLPATRPLIRRGSHSASRPVPSTATPHRATAGAAGRRTASAAAPPSAASPPSAAPASATVPGRSAVAAGHITAAAHRKSASAHGHTTSSSTSHGKSASAPGHGTSSSTTTSTSPGHSGSAPGHSSSSSTAPGHSGSAPGHSSSAGAGAPGAAGSSQIAVAPGTATVPTVTITEPLPADPPGAAVAAAHKKH
jgi:RNA polymerase sigma factor (sigma-70 family)